MSHATSSRTCDRSSAPTRLIVAGCIAKLRPELATGGDEDAVPLEAIDHLMYDLDDNARRLAVNHLQSAPQDLQAFLDERKEEVFAGYAASAGSDSAAQRSHSRPFHLAFRAVRAYKCCLESRLDVCSGRSYSIKACTGCLGVCAYCSVRQTRGTVRSKTIDEVMNEFLNGLDMGYRDIALLGTDLGDYGNDLGLDFIDLLREMVDVPRPFNLRLRNVNPRWIGARWREFCEVAQGGRITYMQVALQSGSDRILALMSRGHRAGELMDALAQVRRRAPRIILRTQLIAGFPTETDADFEASMAVLKSGLFDYADVFRYTARPGTPAAEIRPEVPWDTIMRRYEALFAETTFRHPTRAMSALRRMKSAPVPV
jgi:tRNA A37 methylthiotransferase MiaB